MRTTNEDFAGFNETFEKACLLAKIKPTARQAGKYRNKKGLAYKFKTEAVIVLKTEREV